MTAKCRICRVGDLAPPLSLNELMFGTQESFLYGRCALCNCLQIVAEPVDMARYYPENYYSYARVAPGVLQNVKNRIRSLFAHYGPGWLFQGRDWWELGERRALREIGATRSMRILDLGCGSGDLIVSLADIGFRNVLGADPFIARDIVYPNGVQILKREADQIEGLFDIVMMHHSLEHVWDQHRLATSAARLLKNGGHCIVRIPTIDSWAWEEYGPQWIQLDPPRHFYLHSRASIKQLLESAGLEVTRLVDDSTSFQILGSEKIRRGAPLINPGTGKPDYEDFLPPSVIATASSSAYRLNRTGRGDSIAVHARKR